MRSSCKWVLGLIFGPQRSSWFSRTWSWTRYGCWLLRCWCEVRLIWCRWTWIWLLPPGANANVFVVVRRMNRTAGEPLKNIFLRKRFPIPGSGIAWGAVPWRRHSRSVFPWGRPGWVRHRVSCGRQGRYLGFQAGIFCCQHRWHCQCYRRLPEKWRTPSCLYLHPLGGL